MESVHVHSAAAAGRARSMGGRWIWHTKQEGQRFPGSLLVMQSLRGMVWPDMKAEARNAVSLGEAIDYEVPGEDLLRNEPFPY